MLLTHGLVLIRYRQYRAVGCPARMALRFARLDASGRWAFIPSGWFNRACAEAARV